MTGLAEHLSSPTLQEIALGGVPGVRDGRLVGRHRLGAPAEATEQVRANRVEEG